MLVWEFPGHKQLVYEDDTEKRAFIMYDEKKYSFNEKSTLYKIMKAIDNGVTSDEEFAKVNLFGMIRKRLSIAIEHKKGSDGEMRAKITSYNKVGKSAPQFTPSDTAYLFYIDEEGKHFTTDNYAELPFWIREKIKKSDEGVKYAANNGIFNDPVRSDNDDHGSEHGEENFNMPDGFEFSDPDNLGYEEYRKSGWNDRQLYDAGLLKKLAKPTAPAPSTTAPAPEPKAPPTAPAPKESMNPFTADEEDDLPF